MIHYQFAALRILKLESHWAATVGDKLRTAFASDFLKCLKTFVGFSLSSRESQGFALVSLEIGICNMFKQIREQIFTQNSHRVVAGVPNPSQFSFRESESARNVRQLCEGLATCETKL